MRRVTAILLGLIYFALFGHSIARAGGNNYQNFDVALYARVYETLQMKDPAWLDSHWEAVTKNMKVDHIYLETSRDMVVVDQATLDAAKKFFLSKGVRVSGGITVTVSEANQFETYCYANPELLAVLRVGIAVRFELVSLAHRHGDAARDPDALAQEKLLGRVQRGLIHYHHIARSLQVDMVHLHVLGHGLPVAVEPGGVLHLKGFVDTGVQGNVEILVVVSARAGDRVAEQREVNQAQQNCSDASHKVNSSVIVRRVDGARAGRPAVCAAGHDSIFQSITPGA